MTPKQTTRLSSETVHDQRTALVRELTVKENAAADAKTARLKALRLAKEAAEPPPEPPKKEPRKKRS